MRGRKPAPTYLKLVKGPKGQRPINKQEPKLAPAWLEPPDHLGALARQEWARIAPELHGAGMLTRADLATFSAYCQAWGRWVEAETILAEMAVQNPATKALIVRTKNNNAIPNPILGVANKAMADMMRYAVELGMTPSARSRIKAEPPGEDDDPAAKYFT